nr:hypothetical protein [Tanacetum cinerariifolium]
MADQRTMSELLCATIEGYAEAIVVPSILTEQFELKHSLINMMTSDQFFILEKDNPHDHIRWGSPPVAKKRTPTSILTWEDLVSKFINEFFPPQEQQISIAKLTHAVNQQTIVVTTAMTAILKHFQATPLPASVKAVEEIYVTCGGSGSLPSNTIANLKGELKAITTRSGIVLDGPSVPIPPPFINPEEDERVEETLTDQDLAEDPLHPNIPYPSRMFKQKQQEKEEVQIHKFWQMFKQLHINISLADALILIPKYQKMLKALLSNTPLNKNYSTVILKKLPKKLGDPEKFLIPCGFNKLKCKALADLGASINLMPLSVWKKLGLPELISTCMTLELANRAICTPAGIARDVFVSVGKFTFPADFVIVDYESDPRVPLILGRPFLRTARALIDVHGEEIILRDGDERLTLNMRHDTSSYSNQPQKESINLINVFNDSSEDFLEDLFSTNQPSGNPTFPSHLELTSLKVKDDIFYPKGGNVLPEKLLDLDSTKDLHPPHHFDIESDLKEIEYLLHRDPIKDIDSSLKDSIDQIESDTKNVYDDPFDSKGEKIKESKLLIDELDLLRDFLPPSEYDSFISKDFSRVDALPSTNNEDKVFNPCIIIQENLFEVITHFAPEKKDKKLTISHASLMIEDFDPPLYELLFFKKVPRSKYLLPFLSKNEDKVFKLGIHTSKKVHSSLITELSHQGYKVFKINQIFKSPMKIFLFSCRKDTHILAVPCLHFYPLDQFKYGGIGSS